MSALHVAAARTRNVSSLAIVLDAFDGAQRMYEPPLQFDGFDVIAKQVDHSVDCYAYCVVEHDRRGTFDVARAKALAIPPGPLFGKLQRGEEIEIDGRPIRSEEVLGPPRRGRRIAFVTDTRPCDAAIELARDADLLIHEATYANDHADDARERFHSTAEEAARIAKEANVQRLVLTHISARYDDTSALLREASAIFPNTEVAEDLLEIPLHPN